MKVLLTGVASPVAQIVARHLLAEGHQVIGVDRRPWVDAPAGVEMHAVDIRKRAAEDVFRKARPEAVIHMATVTHLRFRSEERYRINLGGTRAVFEYAHQYGAEQAVFVGRHTYYGAGADHALYHHEDDPPMAVTTFPELADLVAADLYACTSLWRVPSLTTAVLRMVYVLGPTGQGTLATFLRGKYVPAILGYDPLYQFMHEEDIASAIVLSLKHKLRGVFNVTGPSPLPLSVLVRETGRTRVPMPEFAFMGLNARFGLPKLPPGAVAHIKYPVVIDGAAFAKATGFVPAHDELSCIADFRAAFPAPR
jgi:UDP-glucose 4-epimerase